MQCFWWIARNGALRTDGKKRAANNKTRKADPKSIKEIADYVTRVRETDLGKGIVYVRGMKKGQFAEFMLDPGKFLVDMCPAAIQLKFGKESGPLTTAQLAGLYTKHDVTVLGFNGMYDFFRVSVV